MSGIVIDETPPGSARYLETTAAQMYHSEPAPGDYPLRPKYRRGWITAPKQNAHSDNHGRGTHKKKLSQKAKDALPPQEKMVRVSDVSRGTSRMMTATEFAKLDWGWPVV